MKGIDTQIRKAQAAIKGRTPVKRNRFIKLVGATTSLNLELEYKARALAGWKGYITTIDNPTPDFVIGAYHQLWQIEKSFWMSKPDLAARPVYHHIKDSIEAHLAIVFVALTRYLEAVTGTALQHLVRSLRRYRTIGIQAGDHIITPEDPLPPEIQAWLDTIHGRTQRTK
ncbi:hypothetical protein [[Pseudopropionibacterium] massiliense]|uniref:hypothetical protein n=1 Tax=[Pseudopropionibacterium] massiliense TaxID=2220000 RepID=UPI0010317482|nr:hypothetical protein [[Pseudopropionibacterium] massiliense]